MPARINQLESLANETAIKFYDAGGSREIMQPAWAVIQASSPPDRLLHSFNIDSFTLLGVGSWSITFANPAPSIPAVCTSRHTNIIPGVGYTKERVGSVTTNGFTMYSVVAQTHALTTTTAVDALIFVNT